MGHKARIKVKDKLRVRFSAQAEAGWSHVGGGVQGGRG